MKKVFTVVVLLIAAGVVWFYVGKQDVSPNGESGRTSTQTANATQGGSSTGALGTAAGNRGADFGEDEFDGEEDEEFADFDDRPAEEIYPNAQAALEAIRAAAKDYDDLVLEQFTEPGEGCSWCGEFYTSVKQMMLAADTSEDERSYYAEVLAISGRVDNIKTLVDAIIQAGESEEADIYAESLELSIGGDDVVQYLSGHLSSQNELLQESAVAAVTNQGSRLAAETLYNHTVEVGDPDGYYSLGIGLAELIPDDDAVPYLESIVGKRDKFSHLAVKALLNHGLEGTRRVIELLTNSPDPDFDRKMLQDAIDHVNYEEEIEEFLRRTAETSNQPVVQEFVKSVLEDFDVAADDDEVADG